ncbi:MAG: germination protein YpeB [Firmicutes bacterium]|nr:germination protein YpeB [Bacillota bacterium]
MLASGFQSSAIFPDLWHQANAALADLARLPLPVLEVQRTSRFLKQTADIAYSIGKKVGGGKAIDDNDWELMNSLRGQAAQLGARLREMQASALRQGLTWSRSPAPRATQGTLGPVDVTEGFRGIEKDMNKYPSLVYDGPFSDHIERREPAGVVGDTVSRDDALAKALAFAPLPAGLEYSAKVRTEVAGPIPGYSIHLAPAAGRGPQFFMDVSRVGGHVVWMSSDRVPGQATLGLERARDAAAQFAWSRGYRSLEPTYVVREQNSAFVLFVHKENNIRIYPDLVKVQVALDSGDVIGFEALGYLMSHRPRTLPAPRLSAAEARRRLNPRLEVLSERLALIPLENLDEVLTYEFRVKLGATDFLVYVNALTGQEERILQVVHAGGGELAM